ncbi:MAG TPA: LamG-like jellyroll fold domain-containing protein [Vicinamibacterales bacterium]|nr:LamG-like jellyroll fold domain-containing protein [Vicinamibacterales bacterium]
MCASSAHAAVAIDVNISADRTSAATTVTSPAFSTAAPNELLLAFIATDAADGTTAAVTGVAGAGVTWSLVVRSNVQAGTSEIWRAFAPAILTGVSVTATVSQPTVSSITVMSFTGVDPSGVGGAGAIGATAKSNATSGAPSASLVTTRAGSWVFGVGNDWDNPISRTSAAGQSLVHQTMSSTGDTYWVQKQNAPTAAAGTTVAISDTAPTTDRFNLAICEVLPAAAPAIDTVPPTVAITSPVAGTVSGTTTIAGSASDNVGVAGVQFQLDGLNLGAELTAAPYSMPWTTTSVADGAHVITAIARDAASNVATSAAVPVNVLNVSTSVGQWSTPFDLGIVAVNAVLMRTGKVLLFSGSYAASWVERVWDPATGSLTLVPNPYYNLFCAGQAQLPDGRILVVGGYDPPSLGAANANIFDPVAQSWSALPNMSYRRWYPTATTLPDGRMLVTSGGQSCLTCLADLPEVFDPATGRFSTLTSARLAVPYYPFMFVMPDGTVVDAGANEEVVATSKLDLTTGRWSTVDPVVRDGHSAAMYLPGKILKTGTAADSGTSGEAAATAFALDLTQATPAWRQVSSMAAPRAFHNTTLLPDGSVLVTGGGTTLDGHDTTHAVFEAELWNPATETWSTLAPASVPRLYHSTALLLPDGRVLSAGGGNDSGAENETQGQIFSPPYLFKGARPNLAQVVDTLQYGAVFSIGTPDAASIASVALMRPGAVTHGFDEDQRYIPLSFTVLPGTVNATAPANANLAPPGYYMLFIVNAAGVPSIARFVRIASPAADTLPPTPPGNLSAQGALGAATLTWTAATDDTGVALYNVYRSTTSGFTPSAATRIGQSTTTQYTDSVTAGSYFYLVTAQDIAKNVSAPSNEALAIVLADTTPPTVAITSPADQATLSGSAAVTATASDDVGVAGVQFQLDGAALGAERVTPPYSLTWNTATTSNGPHTLGAIARDAAGSRASSTITVNVSNTSSAPAGLVAAYSFNEGSGVTTKDSSGQGNTGTLSNATWNAGGRFGSALSFNGTSAWVTVADSASLDLTTGMTLEAWVRPTSGSGWRSAILKEAPGGLGWSLYTANNGSRPVGYAHVNADVPVTGTAAVPLNAWTHLALTFDGAALRLYVNGTLVSTTELNGAMVTTTGALRIGGNSVWGEYFKGMIDEVRIYSRALAPAEIQLDMSTPIQ